MLKTEAPIAIRHVTAEDLPALEWDGEYRHFRRVFRANFEDAQRGQRLMLVATMESLIVGQIFVQLKSAAQAQTDGGKRGYLYALRVKAEWRNRGIGTQLIAAAEAELRRRGFQWAVIAVAQANDGARWLYERLGYRIYSADPGIWHYPDAEGRQQRVEEPSWLMEKGLD